MTDAERQAALEAIAREVAACSRCRLHAGRTRAVPGEGSPDTEVVFVGEGPGEQEDRQGRPFVGASGQLLTELIGSLGWRREDVFITNVVKCRPPGNRDPLPDEIGACAPFLHRQLEVLDPAVVVTVGKHSLNAFRPGERIGRVHGSTTPADRATGAANALVFSMYHPAFALYQAANRQTLFGDIAMLPGALLDARARREAATAETPSSDSAAFETPALEPPALEPPSLEPAEPEGPIAAERTPGPADAQEATIPPSGLEDPTSSLSIVPPTVEATGAQLTLF